MKEILKMMVVLSGICLCSGLALAGLKQATQERIEEQVLTYVQAPALGKVFMEHDNSPVKDRRRFSLDGREITVFPALANGELVGVALETEGSGYGGNIGVMVGFDLRTESLAGIGITTMKETPGLGARVAEHGFTAQFRGHGLEAIALSGNGGDIDGISGATISSTGTSAAVRRAVEIYRKLQPELRKAWS
jgi:electron transport complex protein RnfG